MARRQLVAVLGSVSAPGRLHRALTEALDRLEAVDSTLIDLGTRRLSFADGRPVDDYGDDTAATVEAIATADGVLLATPVYRASYTGSLKNLLDLLPVETLCGKPVAITSMGATQHHHLGVDWQLREVLTWFGALTLPTSVYLTSQDFVSGSPNPGAASALDQLLEGLVTLCGHASGQQVGPLPLAAAWMAKPKSP